MGSEILGCGREPARMTTTQNVGSLLGWHVLLYNTESWAPPLGQFRPTMTKNAFTSLNRWKNSKMKSWIIFWDMWKGYRGHISAFINKVFWEHSHACFITYCPWLPLCHSDRVLLLQKRPRDMQNPKVYSLAHYEDCLPTPLYKDLSSKAVGYIALFCQQKTDTMTQQKSNQNSLPGFMTIYLCNPELMEGLFPPPHPLWLSWSQP